MRPADLAGVMALAAIVHPGLPEDPEVFADRIALYPQGCLVLDGGPKSAGLSGYAVGHPIRRYEPPALNTVLGALPTAPDDFYIHDFALAPEARGRGFSGEGVGQLLDLAAGYAGASLISVYGTPAFWARHGFALDRSGRIGDKLAAYGTDAIYMLRDAAHNLA